MSSRRSGRSEDDVPVAQELRRTRMGQKSLSQRCQVSELYG